MNKCRVRTLKRRSEATVTHLISLISLFMKYTLCMVTCKTRYRNRERRRVIKKMMLAAATAFDVRCEGSATRCKYRGGRAGHGRKSTCGH